MTANQRARFFGVLWPDACAAQGWDANDRERRLDLFEAVLGERKSFSDFTESDFDLVQARCLMLADNLQGAREDGDREAGERRRLCHRIHQFPTAYWQAIARARFRETDLDRLDLSQLTQLRNTLNARENKLRKRALQPPRPEPAAVAAEESNIPF